MKWFPSVPLEELKTWDRKFNDVVFAVGNFDGVHRGHLALLESARAKADELGCRAGVLTFAPHPRRYFAGPDKPPFLLTRGVEQREALLGETGLVDVLVELAFDEDLSSVEAEAFALKAAA